MILPWIADYKLWLKDEELKIMFMTSPAVFYKHQDIYFRTTITKTFTKLTEVSGEL